MFLSANRDTAFRHALKTRQREESTHMEGRRGVKKRFAEVVRLDGLGIDLKETQVHWGTKNQRKRYPSTTSSIRKKPHRSKPACQAVYVLFQTRPYYRLLEPI
jgi:hypothetical protein